MSTQAKHRLIRLCGLLSLILVWQLLAMQISDMILASPWQTLVKLLELLQEASFWQTLSVTLIRLAAALSIGISIGFALGLWAGRRAYVKHFLEPFRWVLMSVPPVIVVLLAMLWFGMGTQMVIFIAVLLLTPSIYINTQKGVEQIDDSWLELAHVYRFTPWQKISRLYIPAISAPLCAAIVIVCCNGVRIVVLAEVLGASNGLGFELANARSNFDISELYAWVITSLLLVAVLELLLLNPVQKHILRWRL